MHYSIQDFLNYIMCERKYSDYTVASYKKDLALYEDFVLTEFEVTERRGMTLD